MPRFLAIDWEQQQLHVVQGTTGRGGVCIEQALTWAIPEPLTAIGGEAIGKKLRDALKEANVQLAPILACVGREKVILKELRFPAVPANEEPAIVRFQAAKELTESPEDSIIDYTRMGNETGSEERHALAVVVRKEVINSLKMLCQGLGQKLLAVTPRPSAVIGALDRSREGKIPVGAVEALLVIGQRWADLGVLRGQTLLFARSLGVGPNLAADVKRSLAVFNSSAETSVQSLFIASEGDEFTLSTRLHESLGLPVQVMDSFLAGDTVQVDKTRRGRFTAAIGLLHRWAEKPELGINFVSPKQPREVANPRTFQYKVAGIAGAVALVALFIIGFLILGDKKAKEIELTTDLRDQEKVFTGLAQESANINALREWDKSAVSWLDEVYDLAAKFPTEQGFRLVSISAAPFAKSGIKDAKSKEKFVAVVTLNGIAPLEESKTSAVKGAAGKGGKGGKGAVDVVAKGGKDVKSPKGKGGAVAEDRIKELVDEINKDGLHEAKIIFSHPNSQGNQDFQIKVNMVRRSPESYEAKLVPWPPPKIREIIQRGTPDTVDDDTIISDDFSDLDGGNR